MELVLSAKSQSHLVMGSLAKKGTVVLVRGNELFSTQDDNGIEKPSTGPLTLVADDRYSVSSQVEEYGLLIITKSLNCPCVAAIKGIFGELPPLTTTPFTWNS